MHEAFIDHFNLPVSDLAAARGFYAAALAPLDVRIIDGAEDLTLVEAAEIISMHIGFAARDRATVDAFHAAALAAGGRDNGAPGLRPHYHPNYYGAFVLDPDGHSIEAVCHEAE